QHDVAEDAERPEGEDVPQLVDEDGHEDAGDPDEPVLELRGLVPAGGPDPVEAQDGADQPEQRVDADGDAEHRPAQVVGRLSGLEEHGWILPAAWCGSAARSELSQPHAPAATAFPRR